MKIIGQLGCVALLGTTTFLVESGCNRPDQATPQTVAQNTTPAAPANGAPAAGDPANGNLATVDQAPIQPVQQADQQPAPQAVPCNPPAPVPRSRRHAVANVSYDSQNEPDQSSQYYAQYASDEQPIYAPQPPPPLPEYQQPECPGENYMWTPGYWSYANTGYYWAPGAWIIAPYVGALWTPPYWGLFGGRYRFYNGYWGSHIGFYGGIDYGFGYGGSGFYGGYWNSGRFAYNRSVTNINTTVVNNFYNRNVAVNNISRASYNGGNGGIGARPSPGELAVLREHRVGPMPAQIQHVREAANNRAQFAAVNNGRPQTVALARPIATAYRAPAPTPQAVQARPLPVAPARAAFTPANQARPLAVQNRPAPIPQASANRPAPVARQAVQPVQTPAARPMAQPVQRPVVTPQARPIPQAQRQAPQVQRPAPQAQRPAPQVQRPAPQVQRPAPQVQRPAPQVQRPAPQVERQAPREQMRSAPAPQSRPQPAPQPQVRQQAPAPRPAPQARPVAAPREAPHAERK